MQNNLHKTKDSRQYINNIANSWHTEMHSHGNQEETEKLTLDVNCSSAQILLRSEESSSESDHANMYVS